MSGYVLRSLAFILSSTLGVFVLHMLKQIAHKEP